MKGSKITLLCLVILHFSGFFFLTGCGDRGSSNGNSGVQSTTPLGTTSTSGGSSLEEERSAVNTKINALSQALSAKDVESAILLFTRKDKYRKLFEDNKEKLPQIGEALKAATLEKVGYPNQHGIQMGGVSINNSSFTFHINMVKIKGEWFFQDF